MNAAAPRTRQTDGHTWRFSMGWMCYIVHTIRRIYGHLSPQSLNPCVCVCESASLHCTFAPFPSHDVAIESTYVKRTTTTTDQTHSHTNTHTHTSRVYCVFIIVIVRISAIVRPFRRCPSKMPTRNLWMQFHAYGFVLDDVYRRLETKEGDSGYGNTCGRFRDWLCEYWLNIRGSL